MDTKIAYCGIYCGACGIYLATGNNELEGLSKELNIPVNYLACEGCRSDRNNLCCMNCGIKRCCLYKNIQACNECGEFPCAVLVAFDEDEHPHHSGVIHSLSALSEHGEDKWLEQQHKRWSCEGCGTVFHWYQDKCKSCGMEVIGF